MQAAFKSRVFSALCLALIVATLGHYWYVLHTYAINAGQGDDFVDILWFFEIFLRRESWPEIIDTLLLANHEHITLLNHVLYVADYKLFGRVNFLHYIWLGHLFVLASCVVLARWLALRTNFLIGAAIAISCYLNLFYWDSSFWPMTAISNQAIILFALLAAWSYQKNQDNIWVPLGWSIAATASQANGLCVFLALLAAMLFEAWQNRTKPNIRNVLIVAGIFIVVAIAYGWRENPLAVPNHLDRHILYTEPQIIQEYHNDKTEAPTGRDLLEKVITRVPLSIIGAFGATVWHFEQLQPAIFTGLALLLLLCVGRYHSGNLDRFTCVIFFFCIASLLLIALGRSLFFGAESCMLSRYRMYGFLMVLVVANGFLNGKYRGAAVVIVLMAGVLTQILGLQNIPDIAKNRDVVLTSYYYWMIDGGLGRSQMTFYPHNRDVRLQHAYESGYYNAIDAIADANKPAAVTVQPVSACPAGVTMPAHNLIEAWSKKPKAFATEIKMAAMGSEAAGENEIWFCNDTAAYRAVLTATQFNAATGTYWPQLILKKQLPPAQYSSYIRNVADNSWQPLGAIVVR